MIPANERNYYRDIHSISQSLESIAKSLKQISANTKPIAYCVNDPSEEQEDFNKELANPILSGDRSRENSDV